MTYEEKKKLIEAAKVIQEHCIKRSKTACGDCPFFDCGCSLCANYPTYWRVPTITRWTKEDVALARALKTDGIVSILRISNGEINFFGTMYAGELLNSNMFLGLDYDEEIDLDTIIKEAEE